MGAGAPVTVSARTLESMAHIRNLLKRGRTLSLEFFPPKTPEAMTALNGVLDELGDLPPGFVSVTYGAGGSTREMTRDIVVDICQNRRFPAMAHLTCVGHTKQEVTDLLHDYLDNGVQNILAIAGDPPADGSDPGGDFRFATDLVQLIRDTGDFTVAVAAHPELHPRSERTRDDRAHLAAKLFMADFGITQFFFDPEPYLRLRDDLARLGCDTPVIPGVIAPSNPTSVARMAGMNRARIPPRLWERLENASPNDRMVIAVEFTVNLCEELLAEGAPGLHIYTMNRAEAAAKVVRALGYAR